MANELRITLTVDDRGTIKITQAAQELGKLKAAAGQAGMEAVKSGRLAAQAGVDYDKLSRRVAMAQAKMVALYGTVRGSAHLFRSAMESVDYYQKAIIRLAASEADLAKTQEEAQKIYDASKEKYEELIKYAMQASAKYFANAREMLMVMEWAGARHLDISKETIDYIGLFIDKIKQLVPWIQQEGQVLQELNSLWEGRARVTDTFARLVIARLKEMGKITATEGKEVQKQLKAILQEWKEEGFTAFLKHVFELFQGAKVASKDIQNTWESTLETLQTIRDQILWEGFKPVYEDIISYLDEIKKYYLEGEKAEEHRRELAEKISAAWERSKDVAQKLIPIVSKIADELGNIISGLGRLPETVQEFGVIGFFLVGKRGKVVILLMLSLLERLPKSLKSIKATMTGHLSLSDFLFGDEKKLDAGIERLEKAESLMRRIKEYTKPERREPIMPTDPWRMAPRPHMRMMSGWGEEAGFWGRVTPADYWEAEQQPYLALSRVQVEALRDYLRAVKAESDQTYEDIQGFRINLDNEYYAGAKDKAREMHDQVSGWYAGMTAAALQYYQESTATYEMAVQSFGIFTAGMEELLSGFFDIVLWQTNNFADLMEGVLKRIASGLLDILIVQPVVGLIGGLFSTLFGGFGSWLGGLAGDWFHGMAGKLFGVKPPSGRQLIPGGYLESLGTPSTVYKLRPAGGGMGVGALVGMLGLGGLAALMSGQSGGAAGGIGYGGVAYAPVSISAEGANISTLSLRDVQAFQAQNLLAENLRMTVSGDAPIGTVTCFEMINLYGGRRPSPFADTGDISGGGKYSSTGSYDKRVDVIFSQVERVILLFANHIAAVSDLMEYRLYPSLQIMAETANSAARLMADAALAYRTQILSGAAWRPPIYHDGGIIKAHSGYLANEEQLIVAQTGEGILPRRSLARLGRENFEALRRGEFERLDLQGAKRGRERRPIKVEVHINALDRESVEQIDWDGVVRRKIVPALKRIEGRRV